MSARYTPILAGERTREIAMAYNGDVEQSKILVFFFFLVGLSVERVLPRNLMVIAALDGHILAIIYLCNSFARTAPFR